MKKAFTIIEILIAMMILFTAIGFVNISIKAFNNYQRKSENYQNLYITALSLKDWISIQPFDIKKNYEGVQNNIKYKITINTLLEEKNYTFTMGLGAGNHGNFLITLYQIDMLLLQGLKEKKFKFLITKQKSLKSDFNPSDF